MYQIHYLNSISAEGTALWTDAYTKTETLEQADAVLVRSASMHELPMSQNLLAIARAGAGVNNIPLEDCAQKGVVVFNTPGANANSVMELAICGMLLASRDVVAGVNWVQTLEGDISKLVEKGKSKFAGHEIRGKKLGVIGLGNIGGPLANACRRLGMQIYGCDPYISIEAAWHLDSHVHRVKTREEIYSQCDVISVHVPLTDGTRHMIDEAALEQMKDGVIILNFSRDKLVDDEAMAKALASGKVHRLHRHSPFGRFHRRIRGQLCPDGRAAGDGLSGKRQHHQLCQLPQLRYGRVYQGGQNCHPAPEHSQLSDPVYHGLCQRECQHFRPDEPFPGRVRLHYGGSGRTHHPGICPQFGKSPRGDPCPGYQIRKNQPGVIPG